MNDFINEKEIARAIDLLKPDGQLFEIRLIDNNKKDNRSGYFTSVDKLIEAFNHVSLRDKNIYFTLNFIDNACYSRTQHDTFLKSSTTTSDSDIVGYQWLMIDLDPIRAAGVSSTNEELKAAGELGGKVYKYLSDMGFGEPIKAKSGNGYHLLYRIALQNTEENAELIKRCLESLSNTFSNEAVKIDTVNYNPARICKLYGTLAQKGASTADRPHRMSMIFSNQKEVQIVDKSFLIKLAGEYAVPDVKAPRIYEEKFDLIDFMSRNGLTYSTTQRGEGNSTIYCLDECPFDRSHQHGDAKIFHYGDGAIAFKCHHNSCRKYKWQDVRRIFEPDAYDHKDIDREIEEGWKQHNKLKKAEYAASLPTKEFRTAQEIYEDPEPDHEYIRSGISEIDAKLNGLQKQQLTLISGLRASGKSTLLGTLMLQAVEDGHTVVAYSGELANKKYLDWIYRQAAGSAHTEKSTQYENAIGVPKDTIFKINKWLGDKFWLYNNQCGNDFKKISEKLEHILVEKKADLCVIDNLMALELGSLDARDQYTAQTKFVNRLKEIAINTNTHIVFVAHPRKATGFIRLDDVSGSSNIGNAIDNAFMVHRCNFDFNKNFREYFRGTITVPEDATNVIEIAKDRWTGLMDYFVPLYFEENSKRMRNSIDEREQLYSWDDNIAMPQLKDIEDDGCPF